MVPFWELSGHINDLTSKKIPLTAPQNLIAKLFGQQPVEVWHSFEEWPELDALIFKAYYTDMTNSEHIFCEIKETL